MIEKIFVKEIISPIVIVLLAILIYASLKKIIKKLFKFKFKGIDKQRQQSLLHLFLNLSKLGIIIITSLILLEFYNIDTRSILASLGVVAAVAGLALQDLLKDFIAGITIMLEAQYKIGDVIQIGTFKGEVISLTLKTTRLKSYTGEIMIYANRNITSVINYSISSSLAIVDFDLPYEQDIAKAEKIINKLCEKLTGDLEDIKGPVEFLGINEMKESGLTFRLTVECLPMKHFGVQREMIKQVLLELEKNNMSIPYNHVVVLNG